MGFEFSLKEGGSRAVGWRWKSNLFRLGLWRGVGGRVEVYEEGGG